jgi:hypothetical protein
MTEALADRLLPIATDLICVIRDEGPDAVARVLARVPDGRHDALAVILAAMIDPDAKASELLAWTRGGLEYHRLVAAGVNARTAALLAERKAS